MTDGTPPLLEWVCVQGHRHSLEGWFFKDNHLGATSGLWLDVAFSKQDAPGARPVTHRFRSPLLNYYTDLDAELRTNQEVRYVRIVQRMRDAIIALHPLVSVETHCLYQQDWFHIAEMLMNGLEMALNARTPPAGPEIGMFDRYAMPYLPELPRLNDYTQRELDNAYTWIRENVSEPPAGIVAPAPGWPMYRPTGPVDPMNPVVRMEDWGFQPLTPTQRLGMAPSTQWAKANARADALFRQMFPRFDMNKAIAVLSKRFRERGLVYVVERPERVHVWTRANRWDGARWKESLDYLYAGYLCIVYAGEPTGDKYTACLLRLRDDEVAVWQEVVAWGNGDMRNLAEIARAKTFQPSRIGPPTKAHDPNCIPGESWLY